MGVEAEVSGPAAEERLLAHLVRGESVEDFARASGMGLVQLGQAMDLEAVRRTAQGLAQLEEFTEKMAIGRQRLAAALITPRRARRRAGVLTSRRGFGPSACYLWELPQTAKSRKEGP